jgi:hypothetical protein
MCCDIEGVITYKHRQGTRAIYVAYRAKDSFIRYI